MTNILKLKRPGDTKHSIDVFLLSKRGGGGGERCVGSVGKKTCKVSINGK